MSKSVFWKKVRKTIIKLSIAEFALRVVKVKQKQDVDAQSEIEHAELVFKKKEPENVEFIKDMTLIVYADLLEHFNLHHFLGKFSMCQIDDVFLVFFPRK